MKYYTYDTSTKVELNDFERAAKMIATMAYGSFSSRRARRLAEDMHELGIRYRADITYRPDVWDAIDPVRVTFWTVGAIDDSETVVVSVYNTGI